MAPNKKQHKKLPERKISETLLDFASPILELRPDDTPDAEIEKVLIYAVAVWNALIFEEIKGDGHYISEIRERMSVNPVVESLVTELIQRKQTLFKEDYRLIGDYKITRKNGQLNLWAEARDPYSLP